MTDDFKYFEKAAATLEELMSIPFKKPCSFKNKNRNKMNNEKIIYNKELNLKNKIELENIF